MASEVQGVVKALVELAEAMRVERVAAKGYGGMDWETDGLKFRLEKEMAGQRFEDALNKYVEKLSNA